ncbi:MAG: polysaccharide lyase [Myxococcota bacterium]|nr:polysaccharide lyase [Myxococcota bacterium]
MKASSFTDGTVSPFSICTTELPNFGRNTTLNGDPSIELFWTQAGYNGTRLRRGAEACSSLNFMKEGWYGFQFFLPTPGFPTDKSQGIGQIFAHGGCSSWAAMLHVTNNSLTMSHRGTCTPTGVPEQLITANIPRNTWNPIIIHFVASHQQAGTLEVWFGDAVCRGSTPTFRLTGIDFGFGTWVGDTFVDMPNNGIGLKFGMYNFDDGNYTAGETRTIYYDKVSQLVGNPSNAYAIVNPLQ